MNVLSERWQRTSMSMAHLTVTTCESRWQSIDMVWEYVPLRRWLNLHVVTVKEPLGAAHVTVTTWRWQPSTWRYAVSDNPNMSERRTSHVDGCHLTCGHMWDEPSTGESLDIRVSERLPAYLHVDDCHLHVVHCDMSRLGLLRQLMSQWPHGDDSHRHGGTHSDMSRWESLDSSVWEHSTTMSMTAIDMWSLCMSRWESSDSSCLRGVPPCRWLSSHMWPLWRWQPSTWRYASQTWTSKDSEWLLTVTTWRWQPSTWRYALSDMSRCLRTP